MNKKFLLLFSLIAAFLTVSFVAHAGVSINTGSGVFGGKITNTKATQIQELEGQGYTCNTSGQTIEINPIKGPSSLAIQSGTNSRTGNAIKNGQWIIGKYKGKTTITCEKECPPTVCTSVVTLDTVSMYGNSK